MLINCGYRIRCAGVDWFFFFEHSMIHCSTLSEFLTFYFQFWISSEKKAIIFDLNYYLVCFGTEKNRNVISIYRLPINQFWKFFFLLIVILTRIQLLVHEGEKYVGNIVYIFNTYCPHCFLYLCFIWSSWSFQLTKKIRSRPIATIRWAKVGHLHLSV